MNIVDSSGWLEYFSDGKNAEFFQKPIRDTKNLVVPTIILFEVFKKIILQKDESAALEAMGVLMQGRVVDLTKPVALNAARISVKYKIPMADSIILATARHENAVLWTEDVHFKSLPGVKYILK